MIQRPSRNAKTREVAPFPERVPAGGGVAIIEPEHGHSELGRFDEAHDLGVERPGRPGEPAPVHRDGLVHGSDDAAVGRDQGPSRRARSAGVVISTSPIASSRTQRILRAFRHLSMRLISVRVRRRSRVSSGRRDFEGRSRSGVRRDPSGGLVQVCAAAYLAAIERNGRGIVLMQDSTAFIEEIRHRNRAVRVARVLVPELRRRGYRFVRLDAIPQVASAARVSSQWALAHGDGAFVSAPPMGDDLVLVPRAVEVTPDLVLGAVRLGADRWALRGANGPFLSPRRNGDLFADAPSPGDREHLTVVERGGGRIALRTVDGFYLTGGRDGLARLRADARTPGDAETFTRLVVHAAGRSEGSRSAGGRGPRTDANPAHPFGPTPRRGIPSSTDGGIFGDARRGTPSVSFADRGGRPRWQSPISATGS
jgi:hypothetical protein